MKKIYKNREVIYQERENILDALPKEMKNEYLRDGNITIHEFNFSCEGKIREKFITQKELTKYNLERLLLSDYYRGGLTIDGVPITYFLNIDYGLISTILFSDNTLLVGCENHKFFDYLISHLEKSAYSFERFTNFIRLNLENNEYKTSNSSKA